MGGEEGGGEGGGGGFGGEEGGEGAGDEGGEGGVEGGGGRGEEPEGGAGHFPSFCLLLGVGLKGLVLFGLGRGFAIELVMGVLVVKGEGVVGGGMGMVGCVCPSL